MNNIHCNAEALTLVWFEKGLNGRPLTSPVMVIISIQCEKKMLLPRRITIDSTLLFTYVQKINKEKNKKQMASTYLTWGGREGWQRVHTS